MPWGSQGSDAHPHPSPCRAFQPLKQTKLALLSLQLLPGPWSHPSIPLPPPPPLGGLPSLVWMYSLPLQPPPQLTAAPLVTNTCLVLAAVEGKGALLPGQKAREWAEGPGKGWIRSPGHQNCWALPEVGAQDCNASYMGGWDSRIPSVRTTWAT